MWSGWRRNGAWLSVVVLAAALAGCASGGSSGASSAPTATTAPQATATQRGAASDAFVCATPPNSTEWYAYVGPDQQMRLAHGCATPVTIAAPNGRQFTPIAFSPSKTWLLAWNNVANPQGPDTVSCLALVEISSGAATPTKICTPYGGGSTTLPRWYAFIGWANDTSFYLASTASDASTTVSLVSLPLLTQAVVTKLAWVATVANHSAPSGVALRGDALYYGGYMARSEGGAWLHRFSLTTRADTRIVPLGLAGFGGCQVTESPCTWTGPWDISRDGSKIAYHNPGPTQSLSDTASETTTPLYVAASDGSGAARLFPQVALTGGFNQPAFSPDGRYVVATFGNATPGLPNAVVFERLSDGACTSPPTELQFQSWTQQPEVALMYNISTSGAPDYIIHLELYNVATSAHTPLQPGTDSYVWA